MDKKALIKKYGSVSAAARALGIPRPTLQHRLRRGGKVDDKPASAPPPKSAGKSIADFRAAHDKSFIVPQKIKTALRALGEGWEYEVPFAKLAGVSLADLAAFRGMFEEHIVLVERTKRAWAGTKAIATKMREMTR